jgi:hypothetical protein
MAPFVPCAVVCSVDIGSLADAAAALAAGDWGCTLCPNDQFVPKGTNEAALEEEDRRLLPMPKQAVEAEIRD